MADFSVIKEWLDKVNDDFRFAEANLKDGRLWLFLSDALSNFKLNSKGG